MIRNGIRYEWVDGEYVPAARIQAQRNEAAAKIERAKQKRLDAMLAPAVRALIARTAAHDTAVGKTKAIAAPPAPQQIAHISFAADDAIDAPDSLQINSWEGEGGAS